MARGKARQQRVKKVPQRTCVGCRQVRPKRELVRIVRTPEGVIEVDPTGKRSGRGAYICPDPKCLELALKGKRLDAALEASVPEGVVESLMREISSLTSGKPPAEGR
ncbi:MAG TPA: YlxR family protein [Firmicutes bacterium]|nr:YlxR family protein [Bacillota bacterium]